MFKDARAVDRQHTAASFSQVLQRYANKSESWFDGSVGSVDARLAQCDQLLHSARFTVARLSIADAGRYLRAVETLDADRRSLLALRDDLLTGASNRVDVVGPPGWRTAMPGSPSGGATSSPLRQPTAPDSAVQAPQNTLKKMPAPPQPKKQASVFGRMDQRLSFYPPDPPSQMNEGLKGQWRDDVAAGVNPAERHLPEHLRHHGLQDPHYAPAGFHPGDPAYNKPYSGPATHGESHESPALAEAAGTAAQSHGVDVNGPGHPGAWRNNDSPSAHWGSNLAGTDRRWVSLESAKFIAANPDALDDSHELATRAHAHAAFKTSTFTPARSAEVCRAFVASVGELGRQTYRPHVVRTAAAAVDFPDGMIYLS